MNFLSQIVLQIYFSKEGNFPYDSYNFLDIKVQSE